MKTTFNKIGQLIFSIILLTIINTAFAQNAFITLKNNLLIVPTMSLPIWGNKLYKVKFEFFEENGKDFYSVKQIRQIRRSRKQQQTPSAFYSITNRTLTIPIVEVPENDGSLKLYKLVLQLDPNDDYLFLIIDVIDLSVNPNPEPQPEPQPDTSWYKPKPGTSWQWQLTENIDTNYDVEMYDIDLFETPQSVIDLLHEQGKKVICYFSGGGFEKWRDDANQFPAVVIGKSISGWPGENWLDIRQIDLLAPIMQARLDLAVAKKCDGVEPDLVDGFINPTGFPLTYNDQIEYNIWLAAEAHKRQLSIGLKNDLEQVVELEPYFDWALNEECFQYNECDMLKPFIEAAKAVFAVDYNVPFDKYCPKMNELNFDALLKNLELDAWRNPCR
jgi:hypothetical protein